MRRSALVPPLALLAGCNWVFGLDETKARPDAAPIDAAWRVIHLNLLQATLGANEMPQPPAEVPMPDLDSAGVGVIGAGGALTAVDASSGTFTVPPDITAVPWRLVYQRAGGVPHEFQNLPDDAHVIEPWWGPLARTAPAAGSGYLLQPSGNGIDHTIHRVFTVGTWTEGSRAVFAPGSEVDYDYTLATSLSGPLGTPAAGDRGVLVDFAMFGANSECRGATGSMEFDASKLAKQPQPGAFDASSAGVAISTDPNVLSPIPLSPLDETELDETEQYGFVPSDAMPAFARPPDNVRRVHLANPVLLALRSCRFPLPNVALPVHTPSLLDDNLPPIVHTEVTTARRVGTMQAQLINGLALFTRSSGTMFDVHTDIAFAGDIMLDASPLMGASENPPVGPPIDGVYHLTWSKTMPGAKADFWQVTLLEITGGLAVPRRIYTTVSPALTIVAADLPSGPTYAFAVAAFTGRAPAAMGDFRGISDSQAMSVINSRTFTP